MSVQPFLYVIPALLVYPEQLRVTLGVQRGDKLTHAVEQLGRLHSAGGAYLLLRHGRKLMGELVAEAVVERVAGTYKLHRAIGQNAAVAEDLADPLEDVHAQYQTHIAVVLQRGRAEAAAHLGIYHGQLLFQHVRIKARAV